MYEPLPDRILARRFHSKKAQIQDPIIRQTVRSLIQAQDGPNIFSRKINDLQYKKKTSKRKMIRKIASVQQQRRSQQSQKNQNVLYHSSSERSNNFQQDQQSSKQMQIEEPFPYSWIQGKGRKKRKNYQCNCTYSSTHRANFVRHYKKCHRKANGIVERIEDVQFDIGQFGEEAHKFQTDQMFIEPEKINQAFIQHIIDKKLLEFTTKSHKLQNPYEIACKIYDTCSNAIKQSILLNLSKDLEELFLLDQNYSIKPRELAADVVKTISQISFKNCLISFDQELKETHKLIQLKNSRQSKTFKNNQLCFKRFSLKRQYELRNKHSLLNYSLALSDFIRDDMNRYLNLLKKNSIFFSAFPSLPVVNSKVKQKVKLIPFSFVQGASQVQRIFQRDPILAADMWAVMTLALRSNDLLKIELWNDKQEFVKSISLVQNKTKTHICRYIPKSLIQIGYAARATYPITKQRLKCAISTCLKQFRCAYAFKHRSITQMVTALGHSNKFTQFHRKASTTVNYYIDKNDQKLLDKLFYHGINFIFEENIQRRIADRTILLDLTQGKLKIYKQIIKDQMPQITMDFRDQISERMVASIIDEGACQESLIQQIKQENLGEVIYFKNRHNINISQEQDFDFPEQCISSILSADQFEILQEICLSQASYEQKKALSFCQELSKLTKSRVEYTQFDNNSIHPSYTYVSDKQDRNNLNLVVISSSTKNEKRKYKLYSELGLNYEKDINGKLGERTAKMKANRLLTQSSTIIHKRQPKCGICREQDRISILIVGDMCVQCNNCGFKDFVDLYDRKQPTVKFITTGKYCDIPIKCPQKMKKQNNLLKALGDIHNFSNRYSSKLPAILNCNFINFDNYANEIEFYKKNWSYLPFDVSDSSIVGAGRGLFATRNLSKYQIISIYPGYVATNYDSNLKSNSLFRLGWIILQDHWVQIISDGNVVSDGGRFLNTHSSLSRINVSMYEGVYHDSIVIIFITNCEIRCGSELICDYGKAYNLGLHLQQ